MSVEMESSLCPACTLYHRIVVLSFNKALSNIHYCSEAADSSFLLNAHALKSADCRTRKKTYPQ